jgi:8-oxo-dGTP diphosphatase
MSVTSTFTDPATWYASLPTLYGTAAALITSPSGELLLVKPNYRPLWSLPGGILEEAERPEDGCAREVLEELGLEVPIGPLLSLHWLAPENERPKPMIAFIFDGGVLADFSEIVLQESELDEFRLVPPESLASYVPERMVPRLQSALRARETGIPVYLSS